MTRVKFSSILSILVVLLVAFTTIAKAWDETDFEIFDIVDALEKAEGKGTTFYSWLDVKPSATPSEITKAYRKLSLKWHPDKNKGDKTAKERFARLGVIASILRDPSKRERYNFFYKNGVPRWRGTGYLYSRFRPGLGSVCILLSLIAAGMQYIAGQINYRQEKKRILQFVADARAQMVLEAPKGRAATLGRSFIEIGQRTMRVEVKGDNYIVVYPDENNPVHLNTEWVAKPTVRDLFIVKWPRRVIYKILGKQDEEPVEEVYEDEQVEEETKSSSTDSPKKKALRKRGGGEKTNVIGSKVGGRRRAVRN